MTLAVGNRCYLNVNGGLRSDPPLFGSVVSITGTPPDLVKVVWENGTTQTYPTTSPNDVVEFSVDPDENDFLGNTMAAIDANPASQRTGVVCRTFFIDPDTLSTHSALLMTATGLWFIEALANLRGVG